jgi:hypothetical protein
MSKPLFLICCLFIMTQATQAPPAYSSETNVSPSPPASIVLSPEEDLIKKDSLFSVDQIESEFKKLHSSPHAHLLKQAYEALSENNYGQALKFSASSVNDPVFMDYGLWISAQAYRGLAQIEIGKKKYRGALKSAEMAASFALKLNGECPYSPFLRTLPTLLAQSEVTIAEILWATDKKPQAQIKYEHAFQRLQVMNSLILLKPEVLGHYAEICAKSQTPFCVSWLRKLMASFLKQTSAEQAILSEFPLPQEKLHSFRGQARFSTSYKSIDLDAQAFEAAMKLYFDEKFKDSSKAFEQLLVDYPRSSYRSRARYWMAQGVKHSQGPEKSKKSFTELQVEFPLTYYGLLASQETGIPIESALNATLPNAEKKEATLHPQEIFHLRRAENFVAENAPELAAFELRDFKPRDTLSSPFLVYLAMLTHKARSYSILFSILSELLQRGSEGVLSAYGLHLIFPLDYFKIISKNATETKIDPLLVMSLIKQESAFDKMANSSVGAIGLMQLMPYTALDTDSKVILSDLFDANENIRVGVLYLNKLLTRYKGNIVYALGAYNAGPNAMDRWIKAASPKRTAIEFIESITYRETREYVGAIIRNYFWYARRLKGENTLNLNYFWGTNKT